MNNKFISATFLAIASVSLMQVVSCSSAQNLDNDPANIADIDTLLVKESPVIDSIDALPDCDSSHAGSLYFVLEDSSFQYCNGDDYVAYTISSEKPVNSSCNVSANLDGSTTIRCTDGTSATVKNGTNGEDGTDGSNGKNGSNGSNGSAGATGSSGSKGTDGDGCTMSDDGFGTITMTCGDTQKSWPKAICNLGESSRPDIPSKVSMALMDPSQIPYDPETQQCMEGNSVLATCGDRTYSIIDEFCDNRDNQVYSFTVIGNQAWMSENLNYVEGETWDPESSSDSKEYGEYYTFGEATASNSICPAGWSLPTTEDWAALETSVKEFRGESSFALEYYLMGYYSWIITSLDDPLRFNALSTGMMEAGSAEPTGIDGYAAYWTSKSASSTKAYGMQIMNVDVEETPNALDYNAQFAKADSLTVRCVRTARESEIKFWEWRSSSSSASEEP